MFDGDLDELGLGSRRKATVWVATAPPVPKDKPYRKGGGRSRKKASKRAASSSQNQDSSSSSEASSSIDVYALKKEHSRCPDVMRLAPEVEHGCIEYKQKIKDPNPVRFQQLVICRYGSGDPDAIPIDGRLREMHILHWWTGCNNILYHLGVHDDGHCIGLIPEQLDASLSVLRRMADTLKASISIKEYLPGRAGHEYAVVEVKNGVNENITSSDVRIAVAGAIDSGKSTLIAVLTHGSNGRPLLDNGIGSARTNVLKHKHEIESGRTSSISQQLLGYDDEGRVLNYAGVSTFTPAEIGTVASRQIHFIDMGGHEKYLKTSFYGLTSMLPDYMILCVSAISGIGKVAREQLAMAFALDIPVVVVLTMMDIAPDIKVKHVLDKLSTLIVCAKEALKKRLSAHNQDVQPGIEVVDKEIRAEKIATLLHKSCQRVEVDSWGGTVPLSVPVFTVSNVTGNGLRLLHVLLRSLKPMCTYQVDSSSASELSSDADFDYGRLSRFIVDHTFDLESVGMVVSGTAVDGSISIGQELNLGPNSIGKFVPVLVESIQRSQVPVRTVRSGQAATLALNPKIPNSHMESKAGGKRVEDDQKHQLIAKDCVKHEDDSQRESSRHVDETFHLKCSISEADHKAATPTPPSPTASSLKGTVLLDSAIGMATAQEFECTIVLLGGHWPARGLLSGRWPPLDIQDSEHDVSGDTVMVKSSKRKPVFTTTIHMGNIRQAAQVVSMEEIQDEKGDVSETLKLLPISFSPAVAVVTALQAEDTDGVAWCVARVHFRFMNRPEWVQEGARFIARDRSEGGNLSGIGVVNCTVEGPATEEDTY